MTIRRDSSASPRGAIVGALHRRHDGPFRLELDSVRVATRSKRVDVSADTSTRTEAGRRGRCVEGDVVMQMKMMMAISMMVLAGTGACSGSDNAATTPTVTDGGTSTTPTASGYAPAKCKEIVGLFCARAVTCAPSDAGTPEAQQTSCVASVGNALNCDAATAIGDTYEACKKDMPAIDCAKFAAASPDTLPQSCRGVVQAPVATQPAAPTAPGGPNGVKPNMIFGRQTSAGDFNVYLGCLCNDVEPDSVSNSVGAYGPQSKFSPNSIWNRFGTFGSDFSGQSVCDQFATDPPIVVNNGQIVGRLTKNQFAAGAIADPTVTGFLNQSVCVN